MRKTTDLNGNSVKLSIVEERNRRAIAFAAGTMGSVYSPRFAFESDAYEQGKKEDARLREEIVGGMR
jgi:hypothetical protein